MPAIVLGVVLQDKPTEMLPAFAFCGDEVFTVGSCDMVVVVDTCFANEGAFAGGVDVGTKRPLNCGQRLKMGLAGDAPCLLMSDVWTLTTPVLPPLVVTRIDLESLMHTVLSSCFASSTDSVDADESNLELDVVGTFEFAPNVKTGVWGLLLLSLTFDARDGSDIELDVVGIFEFAPNAKTGV